MKSPYLKHLNSSKDLETTYAAIRAGFIAQALEKNRRATPFVERARALRAAASQANTPKDLLTFKHIQPALLAAAGVSDKAASHLQDSDKKEAILGLLTGFLEPAGASFVEELVFRFLLIRGDSLGGSMRNIGGGLAQRRLIRSAIACLRNAGRAYRWRDRRNSQWMDMPEDEADLELSVSGLSWTVESKPRTLTQNVTVPIAGSQVDLCLFNCAPEALTKALYRSAASYIALGELKGGIDPAGADEHWKTARTALSRIHEAFARDQLNPHTFFIGAAIEPKMAEEIWRFLESGMLENAANLTDDNQMASLTSWLCSV